MFSASLYLQGLVGGAALATLAWLLSIYLRNVAIVDSFWSLMILLQAALYLTGVHSLPFYIALGLRNF